MSVTGSAGRSPRIVAELGRPETPEETAARKAESSRRHRSNQTLVNLVIALVASLAVVLVLVLVVVRPAPPAAPRIDYRADAAQAQPGVEEPLAAPHLPASWTANADGLDTGSDGVTSWSIGFITPGEQFIALKQGVKANATWVADQLNQARATGKTVVGGLDWTVYDQRDQKDPGNFAYSMTTRLDGSSIVLHGTAKTAEFTAIASAIARQLTTTGSDG